MKSLKKEIITIVALLVVALIGTYVVNASTGSNQLQKPAVEKEVAAVQPAIENNPLEKKRDKNSCNPILP
ncbi:MAG: hypothetical protein KKE44_19185 [Proteobacteria bacterium]|nr:hypothetical protein [Pseudomonadota bacterium]MBU1584858.1 hypothetical protein [Pseudomonadota bacterium]